MWGTSESIGLQQLTAAQTTQSGPQLSRVRYNRPDTWNFLLYCRVDEAVGVGVGAGNFVDVQFDVMVGLGRSNVLIPGIVDFLIDLNTSVRTLFWTTQTQSQAVNGVVVPCKSLPAQTIECSARVNFLSSVFPARVSVTVGAFFAPEHHVRPDWFEQVGDFPGGELQGQ